MADPELVEIMDCTLRDGLQMPGLNTFKENLILIGKLIIDMGIPVVEAGQPMAPRLGILNISKANVRDKLVITELGEYARDEHSKSRVMGLADTKFKNVISVRDCEIDTVSIWESFHDGNELGKNIQKSKNAIHDAHKLGFKDVYFYMVHSTLSDMDELVKFCKEVSDYKYPPKLIYCDTIGAAKPKKIEKDITKIIEADAVASPQHLFIHCHNDGGLGLADTLAAIEAGARGVSGTFLGVGDRCGNVALEQVLHHLSIEKDALGKHAYKFGFEVDIDEITVMCHSIAAMLGIGVPDNQPVIGVNMNKHLAGRHAKDVLDGRAEKWQQGKRPPIIDVGYYSGRGVIKALLKQRGIKNPPNIIMKVILERIMMASDMPFAYSTVKPKDVYPLYEPAQERVARALRKEFVELFSHDIERLESIPIDEADTIRAMGRRALLDYIGNAGMQEKVLDRLKLAHLVLLITAISEYGKEIMDSENAGQYEEFKKWLRELYIVELDYVLVADKELAFEGEHIGNVRELDFKKKIKGTREISDENEDRLDVYEFYKEYPEELVTAFHTNKTKIRKVLGIE